jgi:predicted CXXCH cytochrome family protein
MKTGKRRWFVAASAVALLGLAAGGGAWAQAVSGTVTDGGKRAVPGATVFLVPAADVAKLAKAPSFQIRRNVDNDEPMDDNITANGDKYTQVVTDSRGAFSIPKVAAGRYFVYVVPTDGRHLPGGTLTNKSLTEKELGAKPLAIQLSGKVPDNAVPVGSSRCLKCHDEYADIAKTAHRLGIAVIGKPGKMQDFSRFPEFNAGLDKLSAGAKFWFFGFDKGRGFDKYLISTKAPADASAVSFTATFFKEGDKLRLRTENARDPSDAPRVYTVEQTYGGAVYKQRYLVRVGGSLYPFLQYNPEGKDEYKDRTRLPWRDYHGDWFFDEAAKKLSDPPKKKSFENECASCHYNGYTLTATVGGDHVAGATNDPNGEIDIDGDGVPNEINIGCENCHGAGSEHAKAPRHLKASTIVNPAKLASERSMVICNQCHSRPQGTMKNDQPVNKDGRMLTPGISRNEYLVNHTSREDAAQSDFWGDGAHSKSHHQQGTDLVRSKKYMNATQVMNCADCHDPHGKSGQKHQVKLAVRDGKNSLCASCHKVDMKEHTAKTVGEPHTKNIACVDCHMTKTMQTGAGFGEGIEGKGGAKYWMNDISSHLFDVPRISNKAVKGVDPGKAMPIPYTNKCGTCHEADKL